MAEFWVSEIDLTFILTGQDLNFSLDQIIHLRHQAASFGLQVV